MEWNGNILGISYKYTKRHKCQNVMCKALCPMT